MHPVFSSASRLALYLAFWVGAAVLLTGFLRVPGQLGMQEALLIAAPPCLLYAFVCLTPWYVCRALPIETTRWGLLAVNHLAAAILATALWVEAARLAASELGASARLNGEIPHLVAIGILLYALSVALHYILLALEASRRAEVQARDAELRALKAQVNPHFLFNSLNSIAALTMLDAAKAREMCIHLSDFLRNTLGLGERESIAWKDEVDLARSYLDVEQIRFGARLRVEIEMDGECEECLVPPLVLQPLIENAVKHGIATLVEGGTVRVVCALREGRLMVSVENRFDPDAPAPRRHGLGLRNVRSRLETRFGRMALLSASAADGEFRAEMEMPCQKT